MPIGRSAKKSLRKTIKNHKTNVSFKTKLKALVKSFVAKPSEKGLSEVSSILDKAKKHNLMHKNKVARMKSQLSKKVGKEVVAVKNLKKVAKQTAKKVTKKTVKKAAKKMS
jgi:ribosomal protein S20